ncbi:unnamed protein product [Gordionus sp. m RMFG-2023]
MKSQNALQNEIENIVNELDKSYLRPVHAEVYDCSLKCCKNSDMNIEEFQKCIGRCSEPIIKCQNYLQEELSSFQNRIQRCANDCQDQVKDKMSSLFKSSVQASSNHDASDKAQKAFDQCVDNCFQSHVDKLNPLKQRISLYLSQFM